MIDQQDDVDNSETMTYMNNSSLKNIPLTPSKLD